MKAIASAVFKPGFIVSLAPTMALFDGATTAVTVYVGHPYIPRIGDRVALAQFGQNFIAFPVDATQTDALGVYTGSSTANQTLTSGTWTALTIDTQNSGTRGVDVTRAGNIYTAVTAGRYKADVFVQWPANATGRRIVGIATNVAVQPAPPYLSSYAVAGNLAEYSAWGKEIELNAGDTVTAMAFQDSGASLVTPMRNFDLRRIY